MSGTKYDAFISYSHSASRRLAPSLQSALQKMAKPWYRRRAIHVFRDATDLAAEPELWPVILQALENSRFLIFLASPAAARSPWVHRELRYWIEAGRASRLLIVLAQGEIRWDADHNDFDWSVTNALPEVLSQAFDNEPLWVDLREAKQEHDFGRQNPEFVGAAARLSAKIRGLELSRLIGEDYRQHRKTMRTASAAVVSLIVLLAAATIFGVLEYLARQANLRAARRIDGLRLAAESNLARRQLPQRAVLLGMEAVQATFRHGEEPVPEAEQALRDALDTCPGFGLCGHGDRVEHVVFSATSSLLASAGRDGTVRLWELGEPEESPELAAVIQVPGGPVEITRFLHRGDRLATGGSDGIVRIWQAGRNGWVEVAALPALSQPIVGLAIGPRDHWWIATGWNALELETTARLWNDPLEPAGSGWELTGHTLPVVAVEISPDGRWAATGSVDGDVRLWDLDSKDPSAGASVYGTHPQGLGAMAFSPDSRHLVTGGGDGSARLWTLDGSGDAPPFQPLQSHAASVGAVAASSDGRWIATGGADGVGYLRRIDSAAAAGTYKLLWDPTAASPISDLVFFDGDSRVAASGFDGISRVWRVDDPPVVELRLRGPEGPIRDLAVSSDGRWLAAAAEDGCVRLWKIARSRPDLAAPAHGTELAFPASAEFLSSRRGILLHDRSGRLRVWSGESARADGSAMVEQTIEEARFFRLRESGKVLVAHGDGSLSLVRAPEIVQAATPLPKLHEVQVEAVALSADLRWLLTADGSGRFVRFDLSGSQEPVASHAAGQQEAAWRIFSDPEATWIAEVRWAAGEIDFRWPEPDVPPHRTRFQTVSTLPGGVSISPDRRWLAADLHGGKLGWIDLTAVSPAVEMRETSAREISALEFSADSRWLASAGDDAAIHLWRIGEASRGSGRVLRAHRRVRENSLPTQGVTSLAFDAGGDRLVSGGADGDVRVWDLAEGSASSESIALRTGGGPLLAVAIDGPTDRVAGVVRDDAIGQDVSVILWDVSLTDLLRRARSSAGRDFSPREVKRYFPADRPLSDDRAPPP